MSNENNRVQSSPESNDIKHLPLLPLRDIIVFPHMVVPLFVGRTKSIAALEFAMSRNREILLAAQKKARTNEPEFEDVFHTGTVGLIMQMLRLPDGTVKVLVEGKGRVEAIQVEENSTSLILVQARDLPDEVGDKTENEALIRSLRGAFELYVKLNKRIPPEMFMSVSAIDHPGRLADTIAGHLSLKFNDKQKILEMTDVTARLEKLYELLQAEIEILQVERKIRTRVKKQMERTQKEYYLNEQMQAIQKELGDKDEFKNELQELTDNISAKEMSEEAKDKLQKELRKLKMMAPMSAEATVVRNYIDWVISLPWYKKTEDELDIDAAEAILEEDHYGLSKAKERILEYLAVLSLSSKLKSPILCLVGPPGVGKTSLAKSIARATGKRFVRLSLGGVRDEAEIRGHRRTYIGAMPGKIAQFMKKADSANPVFLLDEIDKMTTDFRGDPASALLEVLDPEQNEAFNDHYLDLDYDMSKVMFITTANNLHAIPPPLQDRLEIIQISGYTEYEKLKIAQRYLVKKQIEANGLEGVKIEITEEALRHVINYYTREAGVRNLEREIASICRKIAKEVVRKGKGIRVKVKADGVKKYLGERRYKYGQTDEHDEIGVVNGLAVTSTGGDLLTTEVTVMPGKGKLIITGKLGDVMQESAQAALSYVRSRAEVFGLAPDFYQKLDIHVHCPEGAIPKDGPSAGITMATSIVSVLTGIPVRRDVAMTGEITLRGRVLEIGGLKEKVLAAHRAGVAKVLVPAENAKDINDVPSKVRKAIHIVEVRHMDEVLGHSLAGASSLWSKGLALKGDTTRSSTSEDSAPSLCSTASNLL